MPNSFSENFISVVIPLFNKEQYVGRAIRSVLNQKYNNFEIIVVDDGSTDGSVHEVKIFGDHKIKLVVQKNQGVSKARNVGVAHSQYNFIAFLDTDDVWLPGFLEQLNLLINMYPDAGIFGMNNYFEYPNGKIVHNSYNQLFHGCKSGLIQDYFHLFAKNGISPFSNSGCCYPKSVFNKMNGYKVGIKLTEDSDLWCRIALEYDIAFFTEPLVIYYMGTIGSTHYTFEPKDFQVSKTLQDALRLNIVKENRINSVKELIAFQQVSLIKRAILSGCKYYALKKMINRHIFCCSPGSLIFLTFVMVVPVKIIKFIKGIK
jgi:glycosyltransferase involved in cell wall biosynthesis